MNDVTEGPPSKTERETPRARVDRFVQRLRVSWAPDRVLRAFGLGYLALALIAFVASPLALVVAPGVVYALAGGYFGYLAFGIAGILMYLRRRYDVVRTLLAGLTAAYFLISLAIFSAGLDAAQARQISAVNLVDLRVFMQPTLVAGLTLIPVLLRSGFRD